MKRLIYIAVVACLIPVLLPGVALFAQDDPTQIDDVETVAQPKKKASSEKAVGEAIKSDSAVATTDTSKLPLGLTGDKAAEKAPKGSKTPVLKSLEQAQPDVSWSVSAAKIFWAVIVLIIGYLLIRWVTRVLEAVAERRPRARLTIKALAPVIRIFGWTGILLFIIARVFAPPMQTLIAFTASAGIAIGFAAQDILKNIFGGIMILFDRPFQVGDKIQVGDHYGEVVHIGLRTVRIVTPDDSLVSIPNGEVANQAVSNSNSGEANCQVAAEFYLPASIDIAQIRTLARRTALISRYTHLNKPIAVVMKNEIHQGRSMLKVRLKAYVLDIRYEFAFQSDMTQILLEELLRRNLVTREELDMVV